MGKRSLARGNISVPCGIAVPAWREIDGEPLNCSSFSGSCILGRSEKKIKEGKIGINLLQKFYRIPQRLFCIPIVTVMTTPLGINIKWKKIYNLMDINAKGNLQGVTLQVLMMRGRVAFPL